MCVVYQIVTVDVQGRSTLVIAAAHGNECAMDMLLKAGSNVNHRCKVLLLARIVVFRILPCY